MNYPIGGLPYTTLGSSHLPKPVPIITKDIWNIFQIVSLPLLRCSLKTLHTIFWLEARVSCFLPMESLLSMEQRNLGLPRIGVEVLKGIQRMAGSRDKDWIREWKPNLSYLSNVGLDSSHPRPPDCKGPAFTV